MHQVTFCAREMCPQLTNAHLVEYMTVHEFTLYVWSLLSGSYPDMIRNHQKESGDGVLNGSANAVLSGIDAARRLQTAPQDVREFASASVRHAEDALDPSGQGPRTVPGALVSTGTTSALTFEQQLQLLDRHPAARIAEAESAARIAEANAGPNAQVALKKLEFEHKASESDLKRKHEIDMFERRQRQNAQNRATNGLRRLTRDVSPPEEIDVAKAVPGVEDQFNPESDEEVIRIALWNTFEVATQKHKVILYCPSHAVTAWLVALKQKRVPHHDRYHADVAQRRIRYDSHIQQIRAAFKTIFPNARKVGMMKGDALNGYLESNSSPYDGYTGIRFKPGCQWQETQ